MAESISDGSLGSVQILDSNTGGWPALLTPFIPGPDVVTGGGYQGLGLADASISTAAVADAAVGQLTVSDSQLVTVAVGDLSL